MDWIQTAPVITYTPPGGLPSVRMTRVICMHDYVTARLGWGLAYDPQQISQNWKTVELCRKCGRIRKGTSR